MKSFIKYSVVIMILFCYAINAQMDSEFLKYFTKAKTIKLDEKAPIQLIYSLDADKNGKILITDTKLKVFLFSSEGKLIKELKSDDCHPGINWKPTSAIFKQNGEIFVQNAFPGCMRFTNEGKCLKKVDDKDFVPGILMSSFTDGSFITYNNAIIPGVIPFCIYNQDGKPITKFGKQQEEFKNFIKQLLLMSIGGMVVDKKDIIYRVNFNKTEILKYDRTGKQLGTIFRKPDKYIQLREDIPILSIPKINYSDKADVEKNKKAMKKFKEETNKYAECTYSEKLFLLDSDLLLLIYTIGDDHGVQIFNTNGTYLLKKDLKIFDGMKPILAKNGYLYFIEDADTKKDPDKFNPGIVVYKYTGKKK